MKAMKAFLQSMTYVLMPSIVLWWFLNANTPQHTNRLNTDHVRQLQRYDQNVQSEIHAVWKRIEVCLEEHGWDKQVKLKPAASIEQISRLEGILGYRLAADYKASLLVHNGCGGDFCSNSRIYSIKRVLSNWKLYIGEGGTYAQNEIGPDAARVNNFWHPGWTPVAGWDVYETIINAETGEVFHWDESNATYQATSWKAWLETVASRLESGEYQLERSNDGRYYWNDDAYITPGSEKEW